MKASKPRPKPRPTERVIYAGTRYELYEIAWRAGFRAAIRKARGEEESRER